MSFATTPNGNYLYVSNRESNNITVFKINKLTGVLRLISNVPNPIGTEPNQLEVTPDGKFLVVCISGTNQLTSFSIDETNGLPTYTGSIVCSSYGAGETVTSINITNDGKFIYTGIAVGSTKVGVFTIDSKGLLSHSSSFESTLGTNSNYVTLSRDNKFLFVSNYDSGSIMTLNIAPDGSVSFASTFTNTIGYLPSIMSVDYTGTILLNLSSNILCSALIDGNGALTQRLGYVVDSNVSTGLILWATPSASEFLLKKWTTFSISASRFNLPQDFVITPGLTFGTWHVVSKPLFDQDSGLGQSYSGSLEMAYENGNFIFNMKNAFDKYISDKTVFDLLTFNVRSISGILQ